MTTRRDFLRQAALLAAGYPLAAGLSRTHGAEPAPDEPTVQRLPLERLRRWEALGFGMFVHFGMSTFTGQELSDGKAPASAYAPTHLDVDQWVKVARDAGMKYMVLTAKHVAGHCLWPSRYTDYTVANSPDKTDVIGAFVTACRKYGVVPGIYYCSWDNHHRFGSMTESDVSALPPDQRMEGPMRWAFQSYTTREYQDFQAHQLEELLTRYGAIGEVWIDIPGVLPRGFRTELYRKIAGWQPDTVIVMNGGKDDPVFPVDYAWPTDVATLERTFPNSRLGYVKRRHIENRWYYLPGESCDTIGRNWFFQDDDPPRGDAELVGMVAVARGRGVNLLLDVPPDRTGRIPEMHVQALGRLRRNLDRMGVA